MQFKCARKFLIKKNSSSCEQSNVGALRHHVRCFHNLNPALIQKQRWICLQHTNYAAFCNRKRLFILFYNSNKLSRITQLVKPLYPDSTLTRLIIVNEFRIFCTLITFSLNHPWQFLLLTMMIIIWNLSFKRFCSKNRWEGSGFVFYNGVNTTEYSLMKVMKC